MSRKRKPVGFDALFLGTDVDLIIGLVERIEGPDWEPENVQHLSQPEAHLVCLCAFCGIFGNGGLEYWLATDSGSYTRCTIAALEAIGLQDAASALADVLASLTPQKYPDRNRRMTSFREQADHMQALERRLWAVFDEVESGAARFVRDHRAGFEHLRQTRPWRSLTGRFGTA